MMQFVLSKYALKYAIEIVFFFFFEITNNTHKNVESLKTVLIAIDHLWINNC